ncbi:hypothetical protein A6U87_12610 [Rhizobium sp. AC44/96]|nr:hypothetical protein A6U87_12610 [Rhizobium sp. AC44/96]
MRIAAYVLYGAHISSPAIGFFAAPRPLRAAMRSQLMWADPSRLCFEHIRLSRLARRKFPASNRRLEPGIVGQMEPGETL